jgi:hypothetical protein
MPTWRSIDNQQVTHFIACNFTLMFAKMAQSSAECACHVCAVDTNKKTPSFAAWGWRKI